MCEFVIAARLADGIVLICNFSATQRNNLQNHTGIFDYDFGRKASHLAENIWQFPATAP